MAELSPTAKLFANMETGSEQSEAALEAINEQITLKEEERDASLSIMYDTSGSITVILQSIGDKVHTYHKFFNSPPTAIGTYPVDLEKWGGDPNSVPAFDPDQNDNPINLTQWHVIDFIDNTSVTMGYPSGWHDPITPVGCDATNVDDKEMFYIAGDRTTDISTDDLLVFDSTGGGVYYSNVSCVEYYASTGDTVVVLYDSTANLHIGELYNTGTWAGITSVGNKVLEYNGTGWDSTGVDEVTIEGYINEFDFCNDLLFRPMTGEYEPIDGISEFDQVTYGIFSMLNQLTKGKNIITRNKVKYDSGITTLSRWE